VTERDAPVRRRTVRSRRPTVRETGGAVAFALVALQLAALAWVPGGSPATETSGAAPVYYPATYSPIHPPSSAGAQGQVGYIGPLGGLGPGLVRAGADGPLGPRGATGAPAPHWDSPLVEASVSVRNGSVSNWSLASGVVVSLENVSFGTTSTTETGPSGGASLTVPAGWYWISVGAGSGRIPIFAQVDLRAATWSPYYLLPPTDANATVANAPAGVPSATRYLRAECGWDPFGACPGVTVTLENASDGDVPLATAETGTNGTATFAGVDPSDAYALTIDGFGDPASGVRWGAVNVTNLPLSGAPEQSFPVVPVTTTTATVTGSPFPGAGGYQWSVTGTATITGGVTYWALQPNVSASVRFVDALVYVNATGALEGGFYHSGVQFQNSTVVYLEPGIFLQRAGAVRINDSYVLGTTVEGSPSVALGGEGGANVLTLGSGDCDGSVLSNDVQVEEVSGTYVDCSLQNDTAGSGSWTLTGSTVDNTTVTPLGTGWYFGINRTFAYNSTLLWGASALVGTGDRLQDTDLYGGAGSVAVNGSWLNLSITLAGTAAGKWLQLGAPLGNSNTTFLEEDYLSVVQQPTFNFSAQLARAGPSLNEGGYNVSQWFFANRTNITSSVLNFTTVPRENLSLVFGALDLFDDDVRVNYSNAQLLDGGTGAPGDPVKTGFLAFDLTTAAIDDCTMDVGTFYELVATDAGFHAGAISVTHDLFPLTYQVFPFAQTQFFGLTHLAHEAVEFANDTWTYSEWNESVVDATHAYALAGIADTAIQDMGGTGNPRPGEGVWQEEAPATLNVTHCTFWGRPLGDEGATDAQWLLLGQYNVTSAVTDDVFENSATYSLGDDAFAPTYGFDVMNGGQANTYDNDWFLNLTNITVPIGSDSSSPGVNGYGQFSSIALGPDLHFEYAPLLAGQSSVPVDGPTLPSQNVTGSPVEGDPVVNGGPGSFPYPLESTVTFEIPIAVNGTLVPASDADQYVFNESNRQSIPCELDWFEAGWDCRAWSWGIAPDVNDSSGVPVVDYSDGGLGGPEPSFVWDGARYDASVEPSFLELDGPTGAPSIMAGFSDLPSGGSVTVTRWTANGTATALVLPIPANGTVEVPYDPATDGPNTTYVLTQVSGPAGGLPASQLIGIWDYVWAGGAIAVLAAGVGLGAVLRRRAPRPKDPEPELQREALAFGVPRQSK
jgi:hypothetical protein